MSGSLVCMCNYECPPLPMSCRTCDGFYDPEGIKEFLFALPRFARDEVN